MTPPELTQAAISACATEKSFQRGLDLYRSGAIARVTIQGHTLSGDCEGTQSPFYRVRAELDSGGVRSASCTCPYDWGGYCKHVVALLLSYAHTPEQFAVHKEPAELLADLDREKLLALMAKLLKVQPDLYEWVEAEIALPTVSARGKTKAAKGKKVDAEVYRRRVRSAMHSLDHMRMSEAYWHVGGLAEQLRGVQNTAMESLNSGDPEAALEILLALIEESHDGFDYIDDSNGELGDFLSNLGDVLAEVILSLDLDEERREDLVSDLEELHSRLSDYGIEGLSVAIDAAEYGWNDMPEEKSDRHSDKDEQDDEWDEQWVEDEEFEEDEDRAFEGDGFQWSIDDPQQALTRAKLNVLERQGRADDYLALCLKTGAHLRYGLKLCELDRMPEAVSYALKHLAYAGEALKLAHRLRETNHLDEAIRVGERGLKLAGRKAVLGEWLGAIQEAQGRKAQALEAWLTAFHEAPSLSLYHTVKRLAGKRWSKLKPDVMATLEKCYSKQPLVEVLLSEQEWDAAIKVADNEGGDYRIIETVAEAVIAHRPQWVIRASIKQAESLIAQTKSSLYPAAADWLKKAKAAYAQSGQTSQWQHYFKQLKEQYKRRPALQAQLSRL